MWANGVSRRTAPSTASPAVGYYSVNDEVDVAVENVPDQNAMTDPGKKWVQFSDGNFGASLYPDGTGLPKTRMIRITPQEDPDPQPAKKIEKAVLHYEDGSTEELFPKPE